MQIRVKLDLPTIMRTRKLAERETRRALARGLSRGADRGSTEGARAISAATKLKVREVRKRISWTAAKPNYLVAEIRANPYAPNLAEFRPTQNRAGVAATAWERRKTYKGAFIHPRTGRVVTRQGDGRRAPLKGLRGPSVPRTFVRADVTQKIVTVAIDRSAAETERLVTKALS